MSTVRKYQYDTSFDPAPESAAEPEASDSPDEPEAPPEPTFTGEQLAAAREKAYAQGHAAGFAEAESSTERMAAEALARIGEQLGGLGSEIGVAAAERHRGAVAAAVAIARKALPPIARDSAVSAVESMVRECLPTLVEEPRVVIRVSESLIDVIQSRLGAIASDSGFGGEVIIIGDAGLDRPDCRIEWADGGAEYDSARIWRDIDDVVARFMNAPIDDAGNADADTVAADTDASDETPPDGGTTE